jgi:TonB family protein
MDQFCYRLLSLLFLFTAFVQGADDVALYVDKEDGSSFLVHHLEGDEVFLKKGETFTSVKEKKLTGKFRLAASDQRQLFGYLFFPTDYIVKMNKSGDSVPNYQLFDLHKLEKNASQGPSTSRAQVYKLIKDSVEQPHFEVLTEWLVKPDFSFEGVFQVYSSVPDILWEHFRKEEVLFKNSERRIGITWICNGSLLSPATFTSLSTTEYGLLIEALIKDDVDILTQVLTTVSMDTPILFGNRVAHYAAWMNASDCLRMLNEMGADFSMENEDEQIPLHLAVMSGAASSLRFLVSVYPNKKYPLDRYGYSPVHYAVLTKNLGLMEALNRGKQDLEQKSGSKMDSVEIAVGNNSGDFVDYLTKQGVKFRINKTLATERLYTSASNADYRVVQAYLDTGANAKRSSDHMSTVCRAALNPDPRVLELLHKDGTNLEDELRESGYRPLHFAASRGRLKVAEWLLAQGVEVDPVSKSGETPLYLATISKHPELVRFFLENGANPDQLNNNGYSAIKSAALVGNRESFSDLLTAGATCTLDEPEAAQMLIYAFQYDVPEIVQLSLEQCITPDYLYFGRYPLYWVAGLYEAAFCQELLEAKGAPLEPKDAFVLSKFRDLDQKLAVKSIAPIVFTWEDFKKYGEQTIKVSVFIDEEGKVRFPKIVESEYPELSSRVLESIVDWTFTPPVRDGEPSTTRFVLPLELKPPEPEAFDLSQVSEIPKVVKIVEPVYPKMLQRNSLVGSVVIVCVIDEHGAVVFPRAAGDYHPDLVKAAIDALKQWKFDPAKVNGKPVKCRVRQPISFALR